MADSGGRRPPYEAAYALWSWAAVNASWVRGQAALKAGLLDLDRLPATLLLDLIYCLVLEDSKEEQEKRDKLDATLDARSYGGRPNRETWGKLPAHQRAMRAAMTA